MYPEENLTCATEARNPDHAAVKRATEMLGGKPAREHLERSWQREHVEAARWTVAEAELPVQASRSEAPPRRPRPRSHGGSAGSSGGGDDGDDDDDSDPAAASKQSPTKCLWGSFSDWLVEGSDEIEWLVEGMFPMRVPVAMVAPPDSGKSLVALHLAISVAAGLPWMGREVKRGRALYLALEGSEEALRGRSAMLAAGRGVPLRELEGWLHVSRQADWRLDLKGDVENLTDVIRENDLALVIIDCLRRAHRQDENSSTGLAQVTANWQALADAGATVLAVHHGGKKGPAGERLRGSTDLHATARATLALKREHSQKRTVFDLSSNYAECGQLFTGRWHFDDELIRLEVVAGGEKPQAAAAESKKETEQEKKAALDQRVLQILVDAGQPLNCGDLKKAGSENRPKISRRDVDVSRKSLEKAGLIARNGRGFTPTKKGREFLKEGRQPPEARKHLSPDVGHLTDQPPKGGAVVMGKWSKAGER